MKHSFIIYIIALLALLSACKAPLARHSETSPKHLSPTEQPTALQRSAGGEAPYARLDSLIGAQPSIVAQYEQKLTALKQQLTQTKGDTERYTKLYPALFMQ